MEIFSSTIFIVTFQYLFSLLFLNGRENIDFLQQKNQIDQKMHIWTMIRRNYGQKM